MKQFITPLSITGDYNEIERFIPELVALGYNTDNFNPWELYHHFLLTKFGSVNGRLGWNQNQYDTVLDIKDKELILALAAMTEGVKVYPGEYIVMVGDYGSPILWINNIYKVLKMQDPNKQNYEDQDDNTFFTLEHDNNQGIAGYLSPSRRDFRKATKHEIYNHFKSKNMPEIKDENGGTNRTMTSYSDTGFKKEIIGWNVKPDIDREAALKIIGWEKNIRDNVGTITIEIKHNSDAYRDAIKLGVLDALFVPVYKEDKKTISLGSNIYEIYSDYIVYSHAAISYKFTKSDLQQLIDIYGSNFSIASVAYVIDGFRFGCNKQIKVGLAEIRMLLSYLK